MKQNQYKSRLLVFFKNSVFYKFYNCLVFKEYSVFYYVIQNFFIYLKNFFLTHLKLTDVLFVIFLFATYTFGLPETVSHTFCDGEGLDNISATVDPAQSTKNTDRGLLIVVGLSFLVLGFSAAFFYRPNFFSRNFGLAASSGFMGAASLKVFSVSTAVGQALGPHVNPWGDIPGKQSLLEYVSSLPRITIGPEYRARILIDWAGLPNEFCDMYVQIEHFYVTHPQLFHLAAVMTLGKAVVPILEGMDYHTSWSFWRTNHSTEAGMKDLDKSECQPKDIADVVNEHGRDFFTAKIGGKDYDLFVSQNHPDRDLPFQVSTTETRVLIWVNEATGSIKFMAFVPENEIHGRHVYMTEHYFELFRLAATKHPSAKIQVKLKGLEASRVAAREASLEHLAAHIRSDCLRVMEFTTNASHLGLARSNLVEAQRLAESGYFRESSDLLVDAQNLATPLAESRDARLSTEARLCLGEIRRVAENVLLIEVRSNLFEAQRLAESGDFRNSGARLMEAQALITRLIDSGSAEAASRLSEANLVAENVLLMEARHHLSEAALVENTDPNTARQRLSEAQRISRIRFLQGEVNPESPSEIERIRIQDAVQRRMEIMYQRTFLGLSLEGRVEAINGLWEASLYYRTENNTDLAERYAAEAQRYQELVERLASPRRGPR